MKSEFMLLLENLIEESLNSNYKFLITYLNEDRYWKDIRKIAICPLINGKRNPIYLTAESMENEEYLAIKKLLGLVRTEEIAISDGLEPAELDDVIEDIHGYRVRRNIVSCPGDIKKGIRARKIYFFYLSNTDTYFYIEHQYFKR